MCNRYSLKIKMFYCMTSSVDQKLKIGSNKAKNRPKFNPFIRLIGESLENQIFIFSRVKSLYP